MNCGAHNRDFVRGSGGMPPENVEILHVMKCVLFVHAYSTYIPASCRLSTTYEALATSELHSTNTR